MSYLLLVVEINGTPFETGTKGQRLLSNLIRRLVLFDGTFSFDRLLRIFVDGLGRPKLVAANVPVHPDT